MELVEDLPFEITKIAKVDYDDGGKYRLVYRTTHGDCILYVGRYPVFVYDCYEFIYIFEVI